MFRQWFLIGGKAALAAAGLLLTVSAASAQQGYFKQLEAQGWGGGSSGRSYRPRYVAPRYEENFTPGNSSYGRSYVYPFQEDWYNGRTYYHQSVVSPSVISEADQRVRIHLVVPANASVSFDGEKTAQTGSARDFVTPPLPSGKEFRYAVRAEWTENGQKMESTRSIMIHAGDRVSLDMSKPTLARKAAE
jgi:uncharacterized protein (TIGR03000 family)